MTTIFVCKIKVTATKSKKTAMEISPSDIAYHTFMQPCGKDVRPPATHAALYPIAKFKTPQVDCEGEPSALGSARQVLWSVQTAAQQVAAGAVGGSSGRSTVEMGMMMPLLAGIESTTRPPQWWFMYSKCTVFTVNCIC